MPRVFQRAARIIFVPGALLVALTIGLISCGTAPTPFIISGPGGVGNEPPTMIITEPNANLTVGQGDPFLIRWTDTDRDSNALISFSLVNSTSNAVVSLVSGVEENDTTGPDVYVVSTTLIAPGTYFVRGVISDNENPAVEAFALVALQTAQQRVVVTIVGPGQGPQTVPPRITITGPVFSLSVAQDDQLSVTVQPTALAPDANLPYDPDSDIALFLLLDTDLDPNNDDPANPAQQGDIIVLQSRTITAGSFDLINFTQTIDLSQIPPRPAGEPYFIRATVGDGTNPRVHSYAVGAISVVQLVSGTVDLFEVGRTRSGALFKGFSPAAQLGSSISTVSDFDADGSDDFVMVAQFGNPQNVGPVGEAYLVYGQGRPDPVNPLIVRPGNRFGGQISVNSIADSVSGVIFQAPPVRDSLIPDANARTDGITDASFVPDLSGDGRPDLLFGLPHVHGAFDSVDWDPFDNIGSEESPFGCYPDLLVNNFTSVIPSRDGYFYAGGMAVMVNSSNRDNSPRIEGATRLERTAISLEYVGQFPVFFLDGEGVNRAGNIFPRADNSGVENLGPNDPDEDGRIAGGRFVAGGYDFIARDQPPREGLFGHRVRALGDQTGDGVPELIVSAPRNERYLADLPGLSTHSFSTTFVGSIMVFPGASYNAEFWREIDGDTGTSTQPSPKEVFGECPDEARALFVPSETFGIFAEELDDFLSDGQSAGDFNQDGLDDILAGAPLNDRAFALPDTGAVYVIYGRTTFGEVQLSRADNTTLRPPMLRVRGVSINDQIGWSQTAGRDVNGDRIDDVFFGSPHTDFGGVTRSTCAGDFDGDDIVTQDDLTNLAFTTCRDQVGTEVFANDPCKVFDYDNDNDIDDVDRCVFCSLSDDCAPDPSCIVGFGGNCANLTDNGFAGVIFGGIAINGDRDITQLATSQLPGVVFFGGEAGDRAGFDVSSAGDFNQDGFGDILISAPGRSIQDSAGRTRRGVVYLVFGGTHLINTTWSLDEVGTPDLPGIIFFSPYVEGRPNEAAPTTVAFIGDINSDGFDDIAIGNPLADFIDSSFPQGPDAPGTDPSTGRRTNVGDVYVIYGNNFGTNRLNP